MPLTGRAGQVGASFMHGGKAMAKAENAAAGGSPWRIAGWGIAALLLLLPLWRCSSPRGELDRVRFHLRRAC